jgi:hypothetical protein
MTKGELGNLAKPRPERSPVDVMWMSRNAVEVRVCLLKRKQLRAGEKIGYGLGRLPGGG